MTLRHFILTSVLAILAASALSAADKTYKVQSPSGELSIEITTGATTCWSVDMLGVRVLEPSAISMALESGKVFGQNVKVKKATRKSVNQMVTPVVYRQAKVKEAYNELTLQCDGYSLILRAYDDGAAYRFVARQKAPFNVKSEEAGFSFGSNCQGFIPYCRKKDNSIECQFSTSFEAQYTQTGICEWESDRLAFLPVTLDAPGGMKVCITESDLVNYPGMYLSNQDKDTKLEAVFAPYPKDIEQGGHNMLQGIVKSREDFIAKARANEAFPWRIVVVAKEDKDLLTCDLPWLLGAQPAPDADFSWVKPGKVAWDWWNAWNIYGVNFEAGVNNDTYKYYIDFAAKNGIEYVILDEGWAVNKKADLFQVVPEIDLPELCKYAQSKGVGLILWAGYWAFEKDMERACKEYSAMGVKGFKVDFMDRDDQPMVDFYRRTAETAARYHLMIDFHGAFKPAGLQRAYPNVVNFEGVYGLENVKGQKAMIDLVTYEVSIPFVRLVAGPADYTQGAMRNATKGNFRFVSSEAMSQGTRCRQLAEYVIFDAPLTMLCDAPSNYLKEQECLHFIADIPTTWDETRALEGKAGEYVAIARRKGNTWYVGAITDWDAREMTLDLSFIKGGILETFRDGANAHRAARDYKHEWTEFPADGILNVKMAPGGGWAAVIRQQPEPWQKTDSDWPNYARYEEKNAQVSVRPKAVLFGDSITQNWARYDQAWLDEHNFVGRGISGQTTMQLLSRIRPDVIDLHPEYMVLLIGINDIARNNGYISVEHTFGNIVSMVQLAQANGIKPVMCTLCPANSFRWRKRVGDPRELIDQLNALITAYATQHGIPLVDYFSVLRTEDKSLRPEYAGDSVHPNPAGYKVMEQALLEVIDKPAPRMVILGLDGMGSVYLDSLNIPVMRSLMAQGTYTLHKRSVQPSSSAINWASIFNGLPSEMHGYTRWNSKGPELPCPYVREDGSLPTLFTLIREQRPQSKMMALYEWEGVKYCLDTLAFDKYQTVVEDNALTTKAVIECLTQEKPDVFYVHYDSPDYTGHRIGWGTPEYAAKVEELDGYVGQIIDALKAADMYDNTVLVIVSDHGGIVKGHGKTSLNELEAPIIISGPGLPRGFQIPGLIMQYDVAPTLASILGLQVPSFWRGQPAIDPAQD